MAPPRVFRAAPPGSHRALCSIDGSRSKPVPWSGSVTPHGVQGCPIHARTRIGCERMTGRAPGRASLRARPGGSPGAERWMVWRSGSPPPSLREQNVLSPRWTRRKPSRAPSRPSAPRPRGVSPPRLASPGARRGIRFATTGWAPAVLGVHPGLEGGCRELGEVPEDSLDAGWGAVAANRGMRRYPAAGGPGGRAS